MYETVVAISKKAKRLHDDERAELEEKLLPWKDMTRNPTSESESDKVFPEQIAISLEFECREKSSHKAVTDYFEHKYDYTIDKPAAKKEYRAELTGSFSMKNKGSYLKMTFYLILIFFHTVITCSFDINTIYG